jgi:hypothetical protein
VRTIQLRREKRTVKSLAECILETEKGIGGKDFTLKGEKLLDLWIYEVMNEKAAWLSSPHVEAGNS